VKLWLLKTEPADYSFADLENDRRTVWDGVSNSLALKHMRGVSRGDLAIIYHTGSERAAVGIATVVSDPCADPGQPETRAVVFEVLATRRLERPVALAELKADPTFADSPLARMPRLSVMPLSDEQWRRIEALAATLPH
jgi:predicted RNA-binding protein with PUA-like domain